jgi:hypothetical protein
LIEPAKPKHFRIGYRRDIVNPLISRLWLVAIVPSSAPPVANFGVIRSEFRNLYDSLGHRRLVVYGLAPVPGQERQPDEILGSITLGGPMQICFAQGTELPQQKQLEEIIIRAGAALPDRIRNALPKAHPTTPFAVWMLALWKHSVLKPCKLMEIFREDGSKRMIVGFQWIDPIPASLFAIDSLKLAKPRVDDLKLLEGDWSVPMSKAQFGSRILGKPKARARDIDLLFEAYDKVRVSEKKWMFRLDTLRPATRRKLEGGIE